MIVSLEACPALTVARDSRHLDRRLHRQHKFRARVAHVADLVIDRPILRNIALPAAADAMGLVQKNPDSPTRFLHIGRSRR
jgi:hypothetical protein